MKPHWTAGVARRKISPGPEVELAGLGYYLQRAAQRIRDDLNATALVISDHEDQSACLLALDLMYNDTDFTQSIRQAVAAQTNLKPEAICINFSHTHNGPTAGLIRGGGERNPDYLRFAVQQTAAAAIEAWQRRQPAQLEIGASELTGMTFNRANPAGLVDPSVGVLRVNTAAGAPLALAVNFHSHCTAHMETDLHAVSRDWPGEVVDQLEAQFPGATALYLQGTAGDVNFRREYNNTPRRFEPAQAVTRTVVEAIKKARPVEQPGVAFQSENIHLPTRRWTAEEIRREREEGLHRLKTGDTTGWLDGMARVFVGQPERLPLRYGGSVEKAVAAVARFAVEWTDDVLPDIETRPEELEVEAQAIRIGDLFIAAHPAELFTTFGLQLRRNWNTGELFVLGYSNGSIGYLPDNEEIARGGYAALQSPKFTGQFPFTPQSGPALVEGLTRALETLTTRR